jgi:hypothetical protein
MKSAPFPTSGKSFSIYEWRGSGPARLHVHHSDDEAWHVRDGELTFRYAGPVAHLPPGSRDRVGIVGSGETVFAPASMLHTYSAGAGARYLIILTPRLSALTAALQADRDPSHQHEICQRFFSELLEGRQSPPLATWELRSQIAALSIQCAN